MKCLYCGQEIGLYDTICKCCGAPQTKHKETAEFVEEKHVEQSEKEDKGECVPEQVLHEGNNVVENKPNKTTKYIILALFALLACCASGYILYNTTSGKSLDYSDLGLIDSADTIIGVVNEEIQNEESTPIFEEEIEQNDNDMETQYDFVCEREVTSDDLIGMDSGELRIMRNWIYARHGYIFKSKDLRDYFGGFSWYSPRYTDVSAMLSKLEKKNVEHIKQYE